MEKNLRNDNKFLPSQKNIVSSLAVVDPMANTTNNFDECFQPCLNMFKSEASQESNA